MFVKHAKWYMPKKNWQRNAKTSVESIVAAIQK